MLMDTPVDSTTIGGVSSAASSSWPWPDTLSWDEMQLDPDWSSSVSLTSLDMFRDELMGGDVSDSPSPDRGPLSPLPPPSGSNPLLGLGCAQPDPIDIGNNNSSGDRKNIFGKTLDRRISELTRTHSGETTPPTSPAGNEKHSNLASMAIAHLSQLSGRLSSMRYLSQNLARAAESSTTRQPQSRHRAPLFQSAAFESVAVWLAHDQRSGIMSGYPSMHMASEMSSPYSSHSLNMNHAHGGSKPAGCQSLLRDVFSSSHRLLEILRSIQTGNISSMNGGNQHQQQPQQQQQQQPQQQQQQLEIDRATLSVIRHLVMACHALLLDIYAAALVVLQHDAYPTSLLNNSNGNTLGDVRLVLVVQLCSYLVERQQQAVDACFPSLLLNHSDSDIASSLHVHVPPGQDAAEREAMAGAREQVQQRLAKLRHTMGCVWGSAC